MFGLTDLLTMAGVGLGLLALAGMGVSGLILAWMQRKGEHDGQ